MYAGVARPVSMSCLKHENVELYFVLCLCQARRGRYPSGIVSDVGVFSISSTDSAGDQENLATQSVHVQTDNVPPTMNVQDDVLKQQKLIELQQNFKDFVGFDVDFEHVNKILQQIQSMKTNNDVFANKNDLEIFNLILETNKQWEVRLDGLRKQHDEEKQQLKSRLEEENNRAALELESQRKEITELTQKLESCKQDLASKCSEQPQNSVTTDLEWRNQEKNEELQQEVAALRQEIEHLKNQLDKDNTRAHHLRAAARHARTQHTPEALRQFWTWHTKLYHWKIDNVYNECAKRIQQWEHDSIKAGDQVVHLHYDNRNSIIFR